MEKKIKKLKRRVDRFTKDSEKVMNKEYRKTLDSLRRTISKLYEEYEKDGKLTFEEMTKYGRLKKLDKQLSKEIRKLYTSNKKAIRSSLRDIAKVTNSVTIGMMEDATKRRLKNIVKEIDVTKVINNEMAGLEWGARVNKHRDDLIYSIQREIRQGLTAGDSYGTMSKRLKKELGTDAGKAHTVVRSESHRVMAETKKETLTSIRKQGVRMYKTWRTMGDERVRDGSKGSMDHAAMDGVTIPEEEDFVLPDGAKGYGPGLTNSVNDINCRCILIMKPVMEDEDDKS